MLIYLEMLYYQSDERGILDVLEIKIFFAAQPLLNIFFKNSISVNFLLLW